MYGILLEGLRIYLMENCSTETRDVIAAKFSVCLSEPFAQEGMHPCDLILRMAMVASDLTGTNKQDILFGSGVCLMHSLFKSNYFNIIRVLGRELGSFLNSLDYLHEHLILKFPKMSPPRFNCLRVCEAGITLKYITRRTWCIHYARGMLQAIVTGLYKINTKIVVSPFC
ncbi:unnamed protein product [Protopolystoma xenopodis]|uniref:Heme NO-binding domain-containing protein n=1 Tax=Protopolystoma xenopodis TaxID=117903 RepID=A0A448WR51_9PLAT|nr:unnamed protein product [Protopolystoma xenopodis]